DAVPWSTSSVGSRSTSLRRVTSGRRSLTQALGPNRMRLAIGSGKCADFLHSRNHRLREMCNRILSRIERLRGLPIESLQSLPDSATELERIDSQAVSFTTYRESIGAGDCLLVVQGFMPSWRFP